METSIDRRTAGPPQSSSSHETETAKIVRQAILLRACIGTVGAIEYLKTYGIDSKIITRVLTGDCVRGEDKETLAKCEESLQLPG